MRRAVLVFASMIAVVMASSALPGTAGSLPVRLSGMHALLASAVPETAPNQTCRDGRVSATGCNSGEMQLAAGSECPATSGSYCSDELPYCCGTPGNYYCAKDVNGC